MVGVESEQEESAPAPPGAHAPGEELVAPVQQAPAPMVRPRSRGEAVFAQVAESEAATDAAARERVSTWRAPLEPAAPAAPQLPPRPISARSRRPQPQASPLALVVVIVAALFFLFSLIFFLMN